MDVAGLEGKGGRAAAGALHRRRLWLGQEQEAGARRQGSREAAGQQGGREAWGLTLEQRRQLGEGQAQGGRRAHALVGVRQNLQHLFLDPGGGPRAQLANHDGQQLGEHLARAEGGGGRGLQEQLAGGAAEAG